MTTSSNEAKTPLATDRDSRFRVVGQAERNGDLFLLVEDAEGQYVFTQRLDDAEQWAVFSECMVGSITARDVAAFVQNAQDGASAAAQTQDVTDHDVVGSGLPESESSKLAELEAIEVKDDPGR